LLPLRFPLARLLPSAFPNASGLTQTFYPTRRKRRRGAGFMDVQAAYSGNILNFGPMCGFLLHPDRHSRSGFLVLKPQQDDCRVLHEALPVTNEKAGRVTLFVILNSLRQPSLPI